MTMWDEKKGRNEKEKEESEVGQKSGGKEWEGREYGVGFSFCSEVISLSQINREVVKNKVYGYFSSFGPFYSNEAKS